MSRNIFYNGAITARIKRTVGSALHSLYLDLHTDHTNSVLICGAGRSGTTWLAEVLNVWQDYRVLYEPFNRDQVPLCKNFLPRQYLRASDDNPIYLEPAKRIFSGRVRNAWVDQDTRPMIARKRLIKDVRSSLMLKWIRQHFPGMPIIFLMRHPCAVAHSRMKLGWRTDRHNIYFQQEALMKDYLSSFSEVIRGGQTPFERHIADWCVENYVPLCELAPGDVTLVLYENLCADPPYEFGRLFGFLGKPFERTMLARLGLPSATARKNGGREPVSIGATRVDAWRRDISDTDLQSARLILRAFGLDEIYKDGPFADVRVIHAMLTRNAPLEATTVNE